MPREIGWSQESNLLYQIKQLLSRASGGGGSSTPAVETYATYSAFPVTGTTGVFYVDSATGVEYVWNGTKYVSLQQGVTPVFPTVVQNGKYNTATLNAIQPRFPSTYFTSVVSAPYINKTYPDVTKIYKAFSEMINTGTPSDVTATSHTVSNFELLYLAAGQTLTPSLVNGFTSITYSDLLYIIGAGTINFPTVTSLTSVSFPQLIAMSCTFNLQINAAGPLAFNLPKVEYINNLNIQTPALSSFTLPECLQILTLSTGNQSATIFSFPKLKSIGSFNMSGTCLNLTTISLPVIEMMTSILTMPTTSASLTNFTFGSSLKWLNSNFVTTSNSLNQVSVDNILISLAALDGSGSTIAYSSRTVTITGGAATPSAAGIAAKNTLIARGCTVTTN